MVQFFKIVLLVLVMTGLHAEGAAWQKLKEVESYAPTEYHLKEGVEYLEVRSYYSGIDDRGHYSKNYRVMVSMQKRALTSFSVEMVKKFKAASPNLSNETNIKKSGICLMSGCSSYISNGFMIDSYGKIWRMNRVEDVIQMLGEIDTPAEVKIVLWLNDEDSGISDENHKDKYRKTSKGYTVISEYDNSLQNRGGCGHFTYRINMNKKGKITKKKLLKRETTKSKYGCVTAD